MAPSNKGTADLLYRKFFCYCDKTAVFWTALDQQHHIWIILHEPSEVGCCHIHHQISETKNFCYLRNVGTKPRIDKTLSFYNNTTQLAVNGIQ